MSLKGAHILVNTCADSDVEGSEVADKAANHAAKHLHHWNATVVHGCEPLLGTYWLAAIRQNNEKGQLRHLATLQLICERNFTQGSTFALQKKLAMPVFFKI